MGSSIFSSCVSACISEGGVFIFFVRVSVRRVFTGLCVRLVIEINCRDGFLDNGYRGKGRKRHAPVEWAP